jgi:hypothetical protein
LQYEMAVLVASSQLIAVAKQACGKQLQESHVGSLWSPGTFS